MNSSIINNRDFYPELIFKTSRSGGKGGQHVNKVETRVELLFHIDSSQLLSEEEKLLMKIRLKTKINAEGYLRISHSTERSQSKNKKLVIEKFYKILEKALTIRKARKKSTVSKQAKEKRLQQKKQISEKKQRRRFKEF